MQPTTEEIKLTILLGTFLVLFFAFIIVFLIALFKKKNQLYEKEKLIMQQKFNEQLLQSQIETQEETFSSISNELHDNIGQLLNSTKLLIGVAQRSLTNYPDTLKIADDTLGTAIYELRSLSKSLSKEWLQQFNFMDNLAIEVKRVNSTETIRIHFTPVKYLPFTADAQIILFRIVQEALQNAIKHSYASNIEIKMQQLKDVFTISVVDDGEGFIAAPENKGMGMSNMQNRTSLLGGTITWNPTPQGTTVLIQLPIKP